MLSSSLELCLSVGFLGRAVMQLLTLNYAFDEEGSRSSFDILVLELGCGSSQLCENLYKDGITNITCIDLSSVAVEKMQKRLREMRYNGIQVLEADMLHLPFSTESFDVVIDKGTMDVLFVDSGGPWNPSPSTVDKVIAMLKCVHRLLRQDDTYISISFGQPHFRRPLFEMEEFTWSIEWEAFGDGFHYFFYTLKKECVTICN
ncbi:uncharacterized protein LOC116257009 isoform X2 [Nymphaea colorata]|uniref:uncharacterized protein LOC116257009 isoform X2 n=1 Tax=Nymphaea colorata TaxID=210225 RepID=UPI00214F571E|nr:uncharacterized protein LOC116257009 isoform X2 [Nymphaea colorata]